ncbi:MAG: hypothetical protein KF809_15030 [Chloroflexi bacterium]|nr:hypothetical protein [Chloroflexota bacterium]
MALDQMSASALPAVRMTPVTPGVGRPTDPTPGTHAEASASRPAGASAPALCEPWREATEPGVAYVYGGLLRPGDDLIHGRKVRRIDTIERCPQMDDDYVGSAWIVRWGLGTDDEGGMTVWARHGVTVTRTTREAAASRPEVAG